MKWSEYKDFNDFKEKNNLTADEALIVLEKELERLKKSETLQLGDMMRKLDFKEQLILILICMNVALAIMITGININLNTAIDEKNEKLEEAYDIIDWLLEIEQISQEKDNAWGSSDMVEYTDGGIRYISINNQTRELWDGVYLTYVETSYTIPYDYPQNPEQW